MPDQCYFNGNFYQCVTATSAGESPTSAAAKWRKIALPSKWRFALAHLTYAQLLFIDGQNDKATVARSIAYGRDRVGVDELVRQEANEEMRHACRQRSGERVNTGRTRPVDASVILDDAWRLIGKDPNEDDFDERDKQDARAALSLAVQEMWEAWWWHELMVCEQMPLATELRHTSSTSVYQDETHYDPADQNYYTSLAPHTLSPGEAESSWREILHAEPEVEVSEWDETATYATGDDVKRYGVKYRAKDPAPAVGDVPGVATTWNAHPTAWQPQIPYEQAQFGLGGSYNAGDMRGPFGPVRSVSVFDPRAHANPNYYQLDVTGDGTRVLGFNSGKPWVYARRVTPVITGDDFDATATYDATATEDLVYDA